MATREAERSITAVREAAADCRACELWEHATQTVFGEGPVPAAMMLVGEQPGNHEDQEGHPFIGAAGQLLDEMLAAAHLERSEIYVTNAVKHYRWHPGQGTRRIHDKPGLKHLRACKPWLEAEIDLVDPEVIVCLGATAAQVLLGREFRLTRHRGEPVTAPFGRLVLATLHPAAVLRARESERERLREVLAADLVRANELARV